MRKAPFRIILAPHAYACFFWAVPAPCADAFKTLRQSFAALLYVLRHLLYIVCCFLWCRARRLYAVHRHCRSAMGLIPHPAVIISAVRTRLASCRYVAVYFSPENFSAVAYFISYYGG